MPPRALVWLGGSTLALGLLAGIAALVAHRMELGPARLDQAGGVLVASTYTAALAVRAGGRPVVFGVLALLLGVATVVLDLAFLRAGAAVLAAVVTGVLAVMLTVPAVRFRQAVREAVIATLVAGVGAFAVVGLRPQVALERFEYLSLALAFGLVTILVYRLGAGLHGLGRRGAVVVLGGSLVLAGSLAYAELLRRYGPTDAVDSIFEGARWVRARAGALPRPLEVLVGVPALLWGTHMRARRRQGWWLCAFGVAATASVATTLVNPATGLPEALLITGYSLGLGVLLGYAAIRLDLLFTAPRGRRGRRAEERAALRPEPSRFARLL